MEAKEAAAASEARARAQIHQEMHHLAPAVQDTPTPSDNSDADSLTYDTSGKDSPAAAGEQEVDEISVAGRKTMPLAKPKQDATVREKTTEKGGAKDIEESSIEEDVDVETELDSILKRSPIIIFSKSYCPHSARAKDILLNKYSIEPAPYVVELDHHPIGSHLQELLGGNTGRRTVPNILVNGLSIGGGDDIAALDQSGELASKIKSIGGKRITEVSLNSIAAKQEAR